MKQEKGLVVREVIKTAIFVIFMVTLVSLTGCGKQFARLEENQSQLKLMAQANAEQLAAVTELIAQNRGDLTAKIEQAQDETKSLAENVKVLGDEQLRLHQTSQRSISNLADQLSQVSDKQGVLEAGLAASRSETAGIGANVTMLDKKQAELYNTVRANNSTLTERVNTLEQGQNTLMAGINDSKNQTLKVSSEVASLGEKQAELHETTQSSIRKIAGNLSRVENNQDALKVGLAVSHNDTAKIANDVTILGQKQAELFDTVQANNSRLTEEIDALQTGQDNLLSGINDSKSQTQRVSSEVVALGEQQAELHETSQNNIRQIADNLSRVASNQETMKAGLVASHNESVRIANEVTDLGQKQAEFFDTFQANNNRLTEEVAALQANQDNLLSGINDSRNQAQKVSSQVASLSEQQAVFHETTQSSIRKIAGNLSRVSNSQDVLKAGLAVSQSETANIAKDLAALGREQMKLQERLQNDTAQMANYLSEIVRNQAFFKTGFVVAHNETARVGNNVASLGEMQKELSELIESGNSSLSERVAAIEQNQSDLRDGIESVRNETRDVAQNISAVGDSQFDLRETVENYNQQLTDRVVVVEQSQQEWQNTISRMQVSIREVAGNISTFEQNLSKLHEIFQSSMSDLTTTANTNNQGQVQFQEKIKNDLLALTESVNVIKQSQSRLQQKIEDVQSNTESITIEFPAAIEQLRQEMTAQEEEAYSSDQ